MSVVEPTSFSTNSNAGRAIVRESGATDMASAPPSVPVRDAAPSEQVRAQLKPMTATATGQVDGAWWPRSRDLVHELDALLPLLAVQLGPVERVSYHLTEWGPVARKAVVDGRLVKLGGYRSQPAGTVDVLAHRHRVSLLVVPPETSPDLAHRVLVTAGSRGNTGTVAELLATATTSG